MKDNIPGYIYRKFAEEHLAAAGYNDPVSVVSQLYEEQLPSKEQYIHEAEQFRPYYRDVMEKAVYLTIIETLAGDDADHYRELYEQGKTPRGRLLNGGETYKQAISQIPEYKPGTQNNFLSRFDELPEQIHETVYKKAFQLSKDNLSNSQL